jgi:hypothetical protein
LKLVSRCALPFASAFAVLATGSIGWADGTARLVTLQGIKSATVAGSGLAFASVGVATDRGTFSAFPADANGTIILGFGLGNVRDSVGVQVAANFTALDQGFGNSGTLSFKFGRQIGGLDTPTFVGLSLDRIAGWGDSAALDESATLALTLFPTAHIGGGSYPLMITAGYGSDILDHHREPGAYVGAGIGITENLGASIAWTGESVTLGTAFKFDALKNVRFSASVEDAFDQVGAQRLSLSATYYFNDIFGG